MIREEVEKMYLKKMLFAVVGVAMLFSGTFPAAAQEQKTEPQVNTRCFRTVECKIRRDGVNGRGGNGI